MPQGGGHALFRTPKAEWLDILQAWAGRVERFFYENAQTYKCYPAIGGQTKSAVIFEVHHLGNRGSQLPCSTFISPAMGRHSGLQP